MINKALIIKIPSLILILNIVSSCWQKYWFDTFEVVNISGQDVSILAFVKNYSELELWDSIYIKEDDSFKLKKDYGESHEAAGIFRVDRPDSVIIKFSDGRFITQVCGGEFAYCLTCKNLMDYHEYYELSEFDDKKDGRYLYTYTITKEDYELSTLPTNAKYKQ